MTRFAANSDKGAKRWLRFIQADPFAPAWKKLGLGDEELRQLEWEILCDPEEAPVVSGTGGLRKIRFGPRSWNRGKRGAVRVYFASFVAHGIVLLVFAHDKSVAETLPEAEKRVIKALIGRVEAALRSGRY